MAHITPGIALNMPDLSHEASYHPRIVCGIDEAGCGPWAGSVVAACVFAMGAPQELLSMLDDSKKLTPAKREALYPRILDHMPVGVGEATAQEIDTLNIWKATELAMQRAFAAHTVPADIALVDGKRTPALSCKVVTIIQGDGISASIAAASIVAKVTRDRMMKELDALYPGYGFARHAGYGTKAHQEALARLGPCPAHRRSYAPIRTLLDKAA